MDKSEKSSIKARLGVVIFVLLMWLVSIFPIGNKDFFEYVAKEAEENISAKTVDDKKAEEIQKALSDAELKKFKLDTKQTRADYFKAVENDSKIISKSDAEKFRVALEKAKQAYADHQEKAQKDEVPLTKSAALLNEASGLDLYKFIDSPGKRPKNKSVLKHAEKKVTGKIKGGIDLKGGVEFTMEFDPADLAGRGDNGADLDAEKTRDTIIEILRNRIDSKGLAEVELRPFSTTAIMIRVPAVNESEVAGIRNLLQKQAKLEFKKLTFAGDPAGVKIDAPDMPGKSTWVKEDYEMTGEHIERAFVSQNQEGQYEIIKVFDATGAAQFGMVTQQNVGQQLAIVLDDVCYSAPRINEPINGGRAQITGDFTKDEAEELAIILQSGSMPVKLKFSGESRIDPSLGAASVRSGILSCIIGLLAVLVFMIFYYRKAGVIAVLALLANILLVIGTMAILGATFTLPGIAGLILTIGMAVDTNVLIFERIREELATGKTLFNSTREGYGKAFVTIFDANVTTLITALILMKFGSGPIQGFAYTLAIGIMASMFTGIFMSRIFFDMLAMDHSKKELGGFADKPPRNWDFWIMRKKAAIFSMVLVAISLGVIFTKGSKLFSVDFTGGNSLQYTVTDGVTSEDVQKRLEDVGFKSPKVVIKSAIGGDQELEVVVRETNADFENLKDAQDNTGLYGMIDTAVRNGKSAEEMKRIRQQTVGGVVGEEFRSQAIWAIALSLIAIFAYITLRFESIFAVGAISALAHDTIISIGAYALLDHQISLPVIAALLTIIGYSLNDTIVVFDRIRENSGEVKKKSIIDIMNVSINGTINRTILTSLTTLFVVVILALFGGGAISDFAIILIIGVVIGTYSSVFVASPIVCSSSKFSTQLSRIHDEKVDREERMKNDQTVLAE
ncbi:MAG: protein translocase subunit SecD [Lentisphaeraceae bacterium]|nr:protein translocase subunit SecD [Lentisphaeraceae bacterium]